MSSVSSTGLIQGSGVASVPNGANNASVRHLITPAERIKREKSVQKEFEGLMPRMIKIISKFSRFQGEVPNIIINALGTGLVAPIFIKYNFLSKTDEDTRTYSAWRQPVSAVLAVVTQAGMIAPFMHLISHMNNNGEFFGPTYNTTAFPDDKYIQEQLKKENPKLTKEELKDLAQQRYNENIDGLVENAVKNNTIEYKVFNGKEHKPHKVSDEEMSQLLDSVAQKMKKEVDDTLTRYAKEKPDYQIQRGEYLRNNHENVRQILDELEKQITEGKSHSEIKKNITSKLKEFNSNKADSSLIKIMEELERRQDNPSLLEKIAGLKDKCNSFSNCSSIEDVKNIVHGRLANRTAELEKQQNAIKELIADIAANKKLDISKRKTIGQMHARLTKLIPDNQFVYDVIQKHIGNIKSNIKAYNTVIGIVVGVAMLPLTCCLLNYLYPRFMDTFFPHLSNKKKPHKDDNDTFVKVNGTIPMEVPDDKKGGKL